MPNGKSDNPLQSAIAITGPGEAPVRDTGEQLALIDAPAQVDADRQDAGDLALNGPRGPGRPPGSRNKRTMENVKFIESQYGMPLEVLAKIWHGSHPNMKKLNKAQKLAVQESAARAALPYMHQKLPMEVEVNKDARVQITIGHLTPQLAAQAEADELSRSLAVITGQEIEGEIVSDED